MLNMLYVYFSFRSWTTAYFAVIFPVSLGMAWLSTQPNKALEEGDEEADIGLVPEVTSVVGKLSLVDW